MHALNHMAAFPGREPVAAAPASLQQPASAAFIRAERLCKAYPSKATSTPPVFALQDVDLQIQPGAFLSILGPSGCGKSTLLKCIAGLEPVTSGVLEVDGIHVSRPPVNMGVVFQRDLLLDWRTVLDNILIQAEFQNLDPEQYRARALELLARFDLDKFAQRYPWQLSGGQRQRVSICRALLIDPQLLLMDEPFGALDAMTRDELNAELQKMWLHTRKTVVFITHSITEAIYLGDQVVVMSRNPGRIAQTLDIDLPRFRSLQVRQTPEFGTYVEEVRSIFQSLGIFK